MVEAPLQVEARHFMPIALAERIREAPVDRPRGVNANQIQSRGVIKHAGDDFFGCRKLGSLHRATRLYVGCEA